MEIKTETMRYNHITDSVYANITRGIDRYSSVMYPSTYIQGLILDA